MTGPDPMRFLSVCSGIEAASAAWHPLGWQCAGVAEIEPFPCAVLRHRLGAGRPRYMPDPEEPGIGEKDAKTRRNAIRALDREGKHHGWGNQLTNFGDFTKIRSDDVGPIDLLVGGTPCQSFSIAGKRAGLDDPRGNLTLEFLALAQRLRPDWIVWENVPGVLSHDKGRTMGTFLALLGECGFRWAYRVLDAQYMRVGRFGRAVPQRRRRVFVVGYSGAGGCDPRTVLFDRESLCGNPAPRREAGKGVAAATAPSLTASGRGVARTGESRGQDPVVAHAVASTGDVAHCLNAGGMGQQDYETETMIAHALRGEGFDASEDGTGRGTPLVPVAIQERAVSENPDAGPDGAGFRQDGAAYTLEARSTTQAVAFAENSRAELRLCGGDGKVSAQLTTGGGKPGQGQPCIAFSAKDSGNDAAEEVSPTLRAGGHSGSHANAGVMPAVAFDMRGREGGAQLEGPHATANIRAASGGSSRSYVATQWFVRRLTPRECERLQGFDDDWTLIPWNGREAENCPDGPRYKAIGNSKALNAVTFIGERIEAVRKAAMEAA